MVVNVHLPPETEGKLRERVRALGKDVNEFVVQNIKGDVRINDSDLLLRGAPDSNHGLGWYGNAKLLDTTHVDGPVLYGFLGGALGSTQGGEKIVLSWKNSGNVGIGTTAPSAALDVVGMTELNGDVSINSNLTVDTDTLFVDGAAGEAPSQRAPC